MKKCYKFFGPFLSLQEKWLNKMASSGYRLVRCGKLLYEFEECTPNSKEYRVEFIGQKSKNNAESYCKFLEDMGYNVFYKNINLCYSIVKVRFRPWAEKGGRLATNFSTFNRELLIIEKENNGIPFDLHTSFEDTMSYYRSLRNPWLFFLAIFGLLAIIMHSLVFGVFAFVSIFPLIFYQCIITKIKRESIAKES